MTSPGDGELVAIGRGRPRETTGMAARLLASGFRPFFLLAALYACAPMLYWLALYHGGVPFLDGWPSARWHAHEMIHGFAGAGVAGFLTTAVPKWTKRPPPGRAVVGGLVVAWLVARAAAWLHGALPAWTVAVAGALFWAALVVVVGRRVLGARNRRNYGFVALLLALGACAATLPFDPAGPLGRAALGGGVTVVALLVAVVGGRIVPAFTYAALERAGHDVRRRSWSALRVAILLCVAVGLSADLVLDSPQIGGAITLLAGALALVNLAAWSSHRTLRAPIVWALHVSWAWLGVGLALRGLGRGLGWVDPLLGLHAITLGAFGGMLLAVMSRATLGHTGRRLEVGPATVAAYLLVSAAALVRVAGPILWPARRGDSVMIAGALWVLAFGIFALRYAPILLGPRVDGRPG